MNMANGGPFPTMAPSGCLRRLLPAGLPFGTASGFGFHPGGGRGWMMHPGASLHSITAVGHLLEESGVGARDP